jgi:hypothetical protein
VDHDIDLMTRRVDGRAVSDVAHDHVASDVGEMVGSDGIEDTDVSSLPK